MPIKTSVSATILEEALNGRVSVDPLVIGQAVSKKVCFFSQCLVMISSVCNECLSLYKSHMCHCSYRLKSNVHTFMLSQYQKRK